MLHDDHSALHRTTALTMCSAENALDRLRGQVQEHLDGVYGEGRALRHLVHERGCELQRVAEQHGQLGVLCKSTFSDHEAQLSACNLVLTTALARLGELSRSFESTSELVDSIGEEQEALHQSLGQFSAMVDEREIQLGQLKLNFDMSDGEMTSLKGTVSRFHLEFTTHVQTTYRYVEEQVEKATSLLTDEVQSLGTELSMEQKARQGDGVRFEQMISLLTAPVDALESKRGVQRASPLKTIGEGLGIQVSSPSGGVQLLKRQFDSIRECLSGLEERMTEYDIKHVPELGQLGPHSKGHMSELSELKLGLAKLKTDCEPNETILQHLKATLPTVSSGGMNPSSKVSTPTGCNVANNCTSGRKDKLFTNPLTTLEKETGIAL